MIENWDVMRCEHETTLENRHDLSEKYIFTSILILCWRFSWKNMLMNVGFNVQIFKHSNVSNFRCDSKLKRFAFHQNEIRKICFAHCLPSSLIKVFETDRIKRVSLNVNKFSIATDFVRASGSSGWIRPCVFRFPMNFDERTMVKARFDASKICAVSQR